LKAQLQAENVFLREEVDRGAKHADIVGWSAPMARVLEQAELLADYLPWVQVVRVPVPPPAVPRCRDPSDVAFLHVAATGKARALVSGDRDLLALAGTTGFCPIVDLDSFCRRFLED